jgi:hypothetical protein
MNKIGHTVESYKFWDIVSLWACERLEHEEIVARALAAAVIRDGLRCHSVDARWREDRMALRGYPYVGYCARPDAAPVILRAPVLEHLLAIVQRAATPARALLAEEFIARADFAAWLDATGQPRPAFWFGVPARAVGA